MPPLSDQSTSSARGAEQKNTLFCPACSHASPTTGDWRVRTTEAGDVYSCPECGARLTTRRRNGPKRPSNHALRAVADGSGAIGSFRLGLLLRHCPSLPDFAAGVASCWPSDRQL